MNDIGIALIWCTVQVTFVSVVAGIIYLAARRLSPLVGSVVVLTSFGIIVTLSLAAFCSWPRWSPPAVGDATSELASVEVVENHSDSMVDTRSLTTIRSEPVVAVKRSNEGSDDGSNKASNEVSEVNSNEVEADVATAVELPAFMNP